MFADVDKFHVQMLDNYDSELRFSVYKRGINSEHRRYQHRLRMYLRYYITRIMIKSNLRFHVATKSRASVCASVDRE